MSLPAPNIIIIERKEREEDREYGAATIAPDNYFEKEKKQEERKGILNICVCCLLIMRGIYLCRVVVVVKSLVYGLVQDL